MKKSGNSSNPNCTLRNRTRSSTTPRKNRSSRKANARRRAGRIDIWALLRSEQGRNDGEDHRRRPVRVDESQSGSRQRASSMRDRSGQAQTRRRTADRSRPRPRRLHPHPPPHPPHRLRSCLCPRRRSSPVPPPARVPVRIPPPPTFFIQPTLPALLVPFLPPPLVEPANPTPPSGTSAVTSPVEAAQKEEEHEEATESVSNQAVAYRQPEHEPSPAYLLGFIVLAAFAGASAFRRPRRGGREVRVAPATISTMRSQRRLEERTRRR